MSYSLEYIITAKDNITNTLNKVKNQIKSIEQVAKNLNGKKIEFKADVSRIKSDLEALGRTPITIEVKGDVTRLRTDIQSAFHTTGTAHGNLNITTNTNQLVTEVKRALDSINPYTLTINPIVTPPTGGGAGSSGSGGGGGLPAIIGGRFGRSAMIAGGIAAAGYVGVSAAKDFATLESAQLGLRKALDVSGITLEGYTNKLRDLAAATGVSQKEITETAVQYAKADSTLNPAQLEYLTRVTYASAKAWDAEASSVTDSLQVMQSIFNLQPKGLENIANQVDLLGDKFGVLNEQYLVDFMTVGAGVGKSAGMSANQLLAWGTVAGESKIIASEASNAMKLFNKALAAPDKDALSAFEKLGVSFDKLKSMDIGQRQMAVLNALRNYQGLDKAQLSTDIIGGNYDDTLLRMSVNADKARQAMQMLNDPNLANGRVMKGLAMEAETAAGRFSRLAEQARNVAMSMAGAVLSPDVLTVWSELGQRANEAFTTITGGADGAAIAIATIEFATLGITTAIGTVITLLTAMMNSATAAGQAIKAALEFDFSGAEAKWSAGVAKNKQLWADFGNSIAKADAAITQRMLQRQQQAQIARLPRAAAPPAMLRPQQPQTGLLQSPIARPQAQAVAVKQQAGIPMPNIAPQLQQAGTQIQQAGGTIQTAGTGMQAAGQTQTQAAAAAMQAAGVNTTNASIGTSNASIQTSAATIQTAAAQQQQAAASQLSGTAGAFMAAANQMMAAAKAFNTAASRPINVNISGGLGTQGR